MYVLLTLFAILALSVYIALSRKFLFWKRLGIPYPPYSTLFGNLSEVIFFKKNLAQVYDDIYRAYPHLPYVGIYKLTTPTILLRDPYLIEQVLVKAFNHFSENDFEVDEKNNYFATKNPFFSTEQDWKTNRGHLIPSLTHNKVRSFFPLMESVCSDFNKYLENPEIANGGIEMKICCEKYTMNVVALTVLGLEANSFTNPNTHFIEHIKKVISLGFIASIKLTILFSMPFLSRFLKVKFIPDETFNYFKNIVKSTIEYRQKNNIVRNDVLQNLQEQQVKLGKEKFPDEEIVAHVFTFISEGYESSSVLLSHALYDLSTNIEHQDKLRGEIENTLSACNGKLTFDVLQDMVYLNKCLKESLRLHSPALFMVKRCTKPFLLPKVNDNSKEVMVERGMPVAIPIYSLHYDPKYFPNPNKFDPERHSNEATITNYTFLPFGEGPRMCIGQKFGMAQIKLAIVNIILNFDVRLNSKTITPLQMDPTYVLMSAKGGIWLNFIKRKKNL